LASLNKERIAGFVAASGDRGPTLVLSSSIQNPAQSIIGTRASLHHSSTETWRWSFRKSFGSQKTFWRTGSQAGQPARGTPATIWSLSPDRSA